MPVTIIKQENKTVFANQFQDGHAYIDEDGTIFIANQYRGVAGVSLCGNKLAFTDPGEDCNNKYTEVNLTVTVTSL